MLPKGVMLAIGCLLIFLVLLGAALAADKPYTNRKGVRVVDGDTLSMKVDGGTVTVRLQGIDAPESDQTGADIHGNEVAIGAIATKHLRFLIGEAPVRLDVMGKDKYGRLVARAYVAGDHISLNEHMVRNGFAHDWPLYSDGEFSMLQRYAKDNGLGIWQYAHMQPWDYRPLNP